MTTPQTIRATQIPTEMYRGDCKADEMLYGAFSYTYVNESTEAPLHDKGLADTTQMVGFMDKDLDGKLSWTELPGYLQKRLQQL